MALKTRDEFLEGLYRCRLCVEERRAFAIPTSDGQPRRGWNKFKHSAEANAPCKFPPIGFGPRRLLFVAINPRITNNLNVHNEVMSSLERFKNLSENRIFGSRYIMPASSTGTGVREDFYDDQLSIAQAAFGNQPFEKVACAVEMYFCASTDADGLHCGNSPCARQYLRQIIEDYVKPKVIVTFGNQIPTFFRRNLRGITARVIHLPFRSPWSARNRSTMDKAVVWAARAAKALLSGTPIPPRDWTWPTTEGPNAVELYGDSEGQE